MFARRAAAVAAPDRAEIDRLAAEGLRLSLANLAAFSRDHALSPGEYAEAKQEIESRIERWRAARLAEATRPIR